MKGMSIWHRDRDGNWGTVVPSDARCGDEVNWEVDDQRHVGRFVDFTAAKEVVINQWYPSAQRVVLKEEVSA